MKTDVEQVTRARKPYYIGRVVDAKGNELARAFNLRDNEAQAKGDASALMREWLRSRVKKQPRHPEERESVPRDPDMLAAWDAGVPMQGEI